jgi:arachidonate 15-lipoxygenase
MPNGAASLPQHCPDAAARRAALSQRQRKYTYVAAGDNPLAPIAVHGKYPSSEKYSLDWALPYLPQYLRSFIDTAANKLWYDLLGLFGPFDKIKAFTELFNEALDLPPPAQLSGWQSDAAFARCFIDGPNPLVLSCVQSRVALADRLVLSDAEFQRALPGASLDDEIAAGNLFLVDYQLLEQSLVPPSRVNRDSRWREKYLPAPAVLFCQRPGIDPFCELVPVAIRIDQARAAAPNPLYLRETSARWELAKLFVYVADFNHQAMSSHIYRHHFVAEPIAVSTRRQLSPEHPIFVLLEPHTRYTIQVNDFAWKALKQPGSVFDVIYAGELPETREIMIKSAERWSLAEQALDADLGARGVSEGPRDYPWREDARLWQRVLDRFADGYVRLFYRSDEEVRSDWELQAWFEELQAPTGGNLRGLTADRRLDSVAKLSALLSQFLFIVGPSHAAVHYPQTDYFTFVPMHPGAAYQPPPLPNETVDEARILQTLPPFSQGADQFKNNQIAYYRFDKFGDYHAYALGKLEAARPLVTQLAEDLRQIESTIVSRNKGRPRPYLYLLPSLVPNSINI